MSVNEELAAEMETAIDEVVAEAEAIKEVVDDTTIATDTQEVQTEEEIKEKTEKVTSEEITNAGDTDQVGSEDLESVSSEESSESAGEKTEIISAPSYISDEILTRAVQVGIPLKVAKTFQSEETLASWVSEKEQEARVLQGLEKKEDPLDALKLDPDVYEPEVIEVVDKLTKEIREQRDQIKELSKTTQKSAEAAQNVAEREVEEWFDGQIKKLDDDVFVEALGSGKHQSLDRGSTQFIKREALATQVGILVAGYQAMGQQPPPRDELFDTAARMTLGDEFQKIHERKLTADLKKRSSQHISRAGGQQATQKQTVEDEIAARLDEKYS